MFSKIIKLGVQIVADEIEEAGKNKSLPFDWNIAGWDKSRSPCTRGNGKSMLIPNPEHIRRKMKAISKK